MPAPAPINRRAQPEAPGSSPSDEECVTLTSDSLHDLASPVNQICSLADLIVKKYETALDEEAHLLFGYLRSSADRLQNLLGGLRAYEKLISAPGPRQPWDGNMLLDRAVTMLDQTIARSAALVTHDSLPELHCDARQITYVFAGLIENSIKFRCERRPEIHFGSAPQTDAWLLSVRDNGIGIDPRYSDRIFRTFKRIHNDEYPGSGVGLAIAKHVIERHGGQIWVESELGHGATFFLTFPKAVERDTVPAGKGRSPAVGADA